MINKIIARIMEENELTSLDDTDGDVEGDAKAIVEEYIQTGEYTIEQILTMPKEDFDMLAEYVGGDDE